ncbi:MAG TPA: YceH family protein [Gammaproteobacteria bacterium]|nr:YceH family protein [Gammaproteobacteria bacterium]
MEVRFTPNEARVIGCLMEKSVITPDQYPLSLNALVNACNQKSSREPVLSLDPGVVQRTVNDLVEKRHVMVQNFGARVDKYQQRFCNTQFALIQFTPAEFAVICLLLLRGPQTPGELKSHSGRLHEFGDAAEVDAALESLMQRTDGPYVARLPREPRRKDHAYAHLFGGPIESAPAEDVMREPPPERGDDDFAALERRVSDLERALADIKRSLGID